MDNKTSWAQYMVIIFLLNPFQALTAEEEQLKSENEAMAKLTGYADLILSRYERLKLFHVVHFYT